jgi:hypothetical protein
VKNKKKMTEEQFVEKFSGVPWDEENCAETASKVTGELGHIAKDFLEVRATFVKYLESIGYEWG